MTHLVLIYVRDFANVVGSEGLSKALKNLGGEAQSVKCPELRSIKELGPWW